MRGATSREATRSMARRAVVVLLVSLTTLNAGCEPQEDVPGPSSQWPAAAAGAACGLIEYDVVETQVGIRFDTAGGATKDDTMTCALTQAGHDFPDLTLTLTETTADPLIYTVTMVPAGSTSIKGLGRIAYRRVTPGNAERGPAVEFGWLSTTAKLMTLRYTFAAEAAQTDVDAITGKLLILAKRIEQPRQP